MTDSLSQYCLNCETQANTIEELRAANEKWVIAFKLAEERANGRIEAFKQEASEEVIVDLAASLAAAISLLERGGKAAKKAAPSDKMFDLMVKDYKASLNRARKALTAFRQENSDDRD